MLFDDPYCPRQIEPPISFYFLGETLPSGGIFPEGRVKNFKRNGLSTVRPLRLTHALFLRFYDIP